MTSQRSRIIFLSLSAMLPFLIYLLTLAPTVVFFDSGELITGSFLLSPTHPPGYPLYVSLGKLATYFPFGSVAYRLNIMAAFFSSLAAMMVFLLTSRIIDDLEVPEALKGYKVLVSFITAITFAFSYNLWNQAIIAEVYPLNTFITGLLIYILLLWRDKVRNQRSESGSEITSPLAPHPSSRLLYLFSFLLGLGLGNHHTLLVLIPILFLVITVTNWRLLIDVRVWSLSLTFFFLGFSIYIFLPLRALQNPELNWGDPDTISKFQWVVLRKGYIEEGLFRSWSLFWQQLKTFNIFYEFTAVGSAIGCLGVLVYARKKVVEVLITLCVFLVLSLGIVIYGNPVPEDLFLIESFHTPSYMIFSIWIGAGLFFFVSLLHRFAGNIIEPRRIMIVLGLLMALLPTSLLAYFYPWNNKNEDYIAYDYAQNELAFMPSNSILFTWGDSGAFPLWYIQMVERYQPGILLVHTPHLSTRWYIDGLPDTVRAGQLQWIKKENLYAEGAFMIMLRENYEKYPLFIDYSTRYSVPVEGYILTSQGLLYELGTDALKKNDTSLWNKYAMRGIYKTDPYRDPDTEKAVMIYAYTLADGATNLLKLGYSEEAFSQFGEAVKIIPGLKQRVREITSGGSKMPEGQP